MEFKVRAARPEDARSIAVLSRALGYTADAKSTRERLRRILGRDDQRVVVAVAPGGAVCGWLQAQCNVVIESGLRVEITGLVAQAETWAKEISAETIVVRSNTKRVESHAFYPSLGYLPSKTQVVYRKRADI
jgi:hypothetical protein